MKRSGIQICTILMLLTSTGFAQNLDDKSRTELILSDSTCVVLYEARTIGEKSNIYYYLPVNLHVSFRGNIPEISLLLYDEDGTRGAIMHFLLVWGLSVPQEEEARSLLQSHVNDSAFIAGSVLVDAAPVSFQITGDDRIVKIMNAALSQNSQAPLVPGLKLAASFRFTGEDADYINDVAKDPEKAGDGKLRMIFYYKTIVQDGFVSKPVEHEWILEKDIKHLFNYLK